MGTFGKLAVGIGLWMVTMTFLHARVNLNRWGGGNVDPGRERDSGSTEAHDVNRKTLRVGHLPVT